MELTDILVVGLLGAVVYMAVLWLISERWKEADIVDFGWASSLSLLGLWYACACSGDAITRAMLGAVAATWGARLAGYLLLKRVRIPGEDGRYKALRESWGRNATRNFFIFFEAQAALAFVLSMSFIVVAMHDGSAIRPIQFVGIIVAFVSIIGESVADYQLSQFVSCAANKGQVCQVGLWRFSRHPNYFFEWLCWCSYPLLAWGSSIWWMSLLSPVMMLFLIVKVTGIPPTEERALVSRPAAYRRYQETTSAFIPWFPRKENV